MTAAGETAARHPAGRGDGTARPLGRPTGWGRGHRGALTLVLAVAGASLASPAGATDGGSLPPIPAALAKGASCVSPSKAVSTLTPWQQTTLASDQAWPLSTGAGVTVAVVDTGVDATGTPALRGRVTAGPDVVSGGTAGTDCVGHGTFVAGLIAGARLPGTGFAGVAPDARVLAVRVTDRGGATTAGHVAAGITAAVDAGARVVDVPIALPHTSPALSAAVDKAVRHGALVVAPAYAEPSGDAYSSASPAPTSAAYPAALPGVLAVAALTPSGVADQSRPPATTPGVAAPGVSVMSVGPGGSGYFTGSGADFASALVAGTAALVDSYRPGLSPEALAARLERTAYHPAVSGPDPLVGWGTVQPAQAVSNALPSAAPAAADRNPLRVPPRAPSTAMHQAWAVAAAAGLLIALTALAAVAGPRGRRRNWRPGVRRE